MSNNPHPKTSLEQYYPDFDELSALAKDDPALFETRRLEYIETFFTKVPVEKQRRLRGLQWQIDQTRIIARTPMASCLTIMNMMRDSLDRLNEHHQNLAHSATKLRIFESTHSACSRPEITGEAKVIPFPAH